MSKNLVIVESPTKAKTIGKFLGSDYQIMSSQGHIRDIEGIGKNNIGIDFEHEYAPNYAIDPQKEALVASLMKAAQKADKVWLASDEDREGEAIAWHLQQVLQLSAERTHRIVFHEITKTAIQEAILHPRDIDYNLVNAQQARRVLDRIVGFELSPVLWKKVTTGLSAGRVQSVAVRLIAEREREIEQFVPTAQYRVTAEFVGQTVAGQEVSFTTELNHRFGTKEEAIAFLEQCKSATFAITAVTHKLGRRTPAPPFTTSSLQQEAARKLHFTVSKTMRLAQALYEAGHITYMRTDSVNLSSLAINTAKTEILNEYGEQYHKARQYQTSARGAQEAHEAIRPTYMNIATVGSNNDERRLYDLIRKRAMATQMADAETDTTRVEVSMTGSPYLWIATHEVITFDGFMRVYIQSADDEAVDPNAGAAIAQLAAADCQLAIANCQETFTKAPLRYNDATLVKKMEELGIGRPSTYATVIETIQSRQYVEKGNVEGKKRNYNLLTLQGNKISDKIKSETVGADTGKFLPTDLGRVTNDFLVEHFPQILSYDFTAQSEESFDAIAAGEVDWVSTVDTFYHTFQPLVKQVPTGKVAARLIGNHPETGEPVLARITKNGPCVQIGDSDDKKPQFASLLKGQSIFSITMDEALDLFRTAFPYTLTEWQGKDIVIGEGKYGPYVRWDKSFVSIPKTIDPHAITAEQAIALLEKNQQLQQPIHVYGDIQVLHGRYGAYIKTPEGNFKIPRSVDAQTLSEEQCREIIANTDNTPKERPAFARRAKK
jgi:DNA topoisomerase-1